MYIIEILLYMMQKNCLYIKAQLKWLGSFTRGAPRCSWIIHFIITDSSPNTSGGWTMGHMYSQQQRGLKEREPQGNLMPVCTSLSISSRNTYLNNPPRIVFSSASQLPCGTIERFFLPINDHSPLYFYDEFIHFAIP